MFPDTNVDPTEDKAKLLWRAKVTQMARTTGDVRRRS